jgi:hypothetical protein
MQHDFTMKSTTLPNARPSMASQFVQILREGALPALRLLARPSTLVQIPRLLQEGLGPAQRMFIQAHNNRELARLIREHEPVIFVASFYRSGSTWMCYLLCDILWQNQGVQTTTQLPVDPDKVIVDSYARLIARRDTSVQAPGCMVKSHELIPKLQEHIGGDPALRKSKFLYFYRTAEDALVSTFHHSRREKWLRSKAGSCQDIDLFCLKFLPDWIEHVTCYLDALDEGLDIHLVSYDQLLRRTRVVLSETLVWLGIPHSEASVARAVSNMEFSKLKALEAKTLGGRFPFFRRGSEGSGTVELKPETLSKIRDATQHLIARANESLARQTLRSQAIRNAPPFSVEPQRRNGHAEVMPASNIR